jgi:hypothetical protein
LGVKNRLERFAWDERVAQVAAESVGCDVRKGVELDPVGQLWGRQTSDSALLTAPALSCRLALEWPTGVEASNPRERGTRPASHAGGLTLTAVAAVSGRFAAVWDGRFAAI